MHRDSTNAGVRRRLSWMARLRMAALRYSYATGDAWVRAVVCGWCRNRKPRECWSSQACSALRGLRTAEVHQWRSGGGNTAGPSRERAARSAAANQPHARNGSASPVSHRSQPVRWPQAILPACPHPSRHGVPPCRIAFPVVPKLPTHACYVRCVRSPWPGWPWCWCGRRRAATASGSAGCRCGWLVCRCWRGGACTGSPCRHCRAGASGQQEHGGGGRRRSAVAWVRARRRRCARPDLRQGKPPNGYVTVRRLAFLGNPHVQIRLDLPGCRPDHCWRRLCRGNRRVQ